VNPFDVTVPTLIVGGGACGAVAALAAREAGVEVLLVEREHVARGTTAMSQGLICAAGTASQRAAGVEDDADTFYADILAKTRRLTDFRLARTIADNAGPALDWLIERHDLPWELDTRFRAAYGHTRMRVHGWLGHGGGDLVELLHARLQSSSVDVLTDARMIAIEGDAEGGVAGIEIARPDGRHERIGCGALVLAAGGFAANAAMVRQYMPEAASARCHGHEGNQGDAMRFGTQLGAALGDMGAYQGYAMLTDPQAISVPPGVLVEGGILVNAEGRRFVNETRDIAGMVLQVLEQPHGLAWAVFDERIAARCAYIPESKLLTQLNAHRRAADATQLARAIGVDADALAKGLEDARVARSNGQADALGRAWDEDEPPCGPLLALKVCGALYHTQGGLQTDAGACVLRTDGTPIRNLFAGGGSARGVSGPSSWGYLPAMGLCAAVTLGRLAGQGAARESLSCRK